MIMRQKFMHILLDVETIWNNKHSIPIRKIAKNTSEVMRCDEKLKTTGHVLKFLKLENPSANLNRC